MSKNSINSESGVVGFFFLLVGAVLIILFFILLNLIPNAGRSNLSFFQQKQQIERESKASELPIKGIRCPDVNGDFAVSAGDIAKVKSNFGANSTNPNWWVNGLYKYDVNGDGAVGAADLAIVTNHFGQRCSYLYLDKVTDRSAEFKIAPVRSEANVLLAPTELRPILSNNCDGALDNPTVVSANQSVVKLNNLLPNTKYCVRLIKAQNQTNYYRLSNLVVFITKASPNEIGAVDDTSVKFSVNCTQSFLTINYRLGVDPSTVERVRVELDNKDGGFIPGQYQSQVAIGTLPAQPASGTVRSSDGVFTTVWNTSPLEKGKQYWFRIITHRNMAGDQSHGGLTAPDYIGYYQDDPHNVPSPENSDGGRIYSSSTTTKTFTYCP
jgi:hypothetical protein